MLGSQPFDALARSPPSTATKNTKHVPCKFFRQGTCQAGNACPFSHSTDIAIETVPCKYFAKGNCKFGAKCALAHILPDGRRVNRPSHGTGMGINVNGGNLNLGGRVEPPSYVNHDSALANSIMTQQQYPDDLYANQYSYSGQDDTLYQQDRSYQYQDYSNAITAPGSNPGSKYGSPTDESRLPISPIGHHVTALDAPMPSSFDSQGISHIARYGPVAASVPSKFGMESPTASLAQRNNGYPGDAFRGIRGGATPGSNVRSTQQIGSSPPAESIGQRLMHSQTVARPKMMSASVPRPGVADDWEDDFIVGADLLPTSLHDDVMTPEDKLRRHSRPEMELPGGRDASSGLRIPSNSSSKVGSPLGSSPSRFSALFAKQREEKKQENVPAPSSAFGHIGSPLRESLLQEDQSTGMRPLPARWMSDEQTPSFSSPPRNSSMSMLAQQLHRTKLERTESGESNSRLQPIPARHVSNPVGRFDRQISSPGLTSTRIDEEQPDTIFSMDDDGSKRSSMIFGHRSPNLRPLNEGINGSNSRLGKEHKEYANGVENLFGV